MSISTMNEEPDVKTLLEAMDDHLNEMEHENLKKAWSMARERCPPRLVNDQHKLMFLRFENFHVELACLRLLRYWSMRLELFGEDKAFQRITLEKSLKEDRYAIDIGEYRWLGTYDVGGCGVYLDTNARHPKNARKKNKYLLRTSIVRTCWYMMECAMEDEAVRENGLVGLMDTRHWRVRDYDGEQMRQLTNVVKCVPIRFKAFHICYPPWFVRLLTLFVIRPQNFGGIIDTPTYYHSAKTPKKLLRKLEQHGIPPSAVPTELGGKAETNYEKWLEYRRELEAQRCAEDEKLALLKFTTPATARRLTSDETASTSTSGNA